jgi:hypothetical protein
MASRLYDFRTMAVLYLIIKWPWPFFAQVLNCHPRKLRWNSATFSILAGGRAWIAVMAGEAFSAIGTALIVGLLLFLARLLLKTTWAAIAVVALLYAADFAFVIGEPTLVSAIPLLLWVPLFLFVWFRLGLLALVAYLIFYFLLFDLPITTQISAWYSWVGLTGLALLLAFALYAFHTSLGGRPMFGRASLED